MKFFDEFREFINEYKIIGLTVAFIMGFAATSLVKSLVDNIIMPVIEVILPNGSWEQATIKIGPVALRWGAFLSDLINFIIIAFLVFIIAKKVLKHKKTE